MIQAVFFFFACCVASRKQGPELKRHLAPAAFSSKIVEDVVLTRLEDDSFSIGCSRIAKRH